MQESVPKNEKGSHECKTALGKWSMHGSDISIEYAHKKKGKMYMRVLKICETFTSDSKYTEI